MTVTKADLRTRLLAERRARPDAERVTAGERITEWLLAAPELAAARVVTAYVGVGEEPPTLPLVDALVGRGVRVLLPIVLGKRELDWVEYTGPDSLAPAGFGLLEPTGKRLGPAALAQVDVALCPGLAVGRDGSRLGRGGGYYDRVLERLDGRAWACALLFAGELLDSVPATSRDQPVNAVVTPDGIT
ncbi:MAG: 5-formyltetrahydrofolate cyclo-ligase, partial [Propionibacteriales bacterium]|nr:5-formyltetrahydrofolate cyclo-ligase [Propionibacteriales bacterium]